jgi:Xaa-Pro aminopeptidase
LRDIREAGSMGAIQQTVIDGLGREPKSLGMELDVLPVNNFRTYEKLFPKALISDVSPLIRRLRTVKSAYELGLIRKANQMNVSLYSRVKDLLKEGLTELEFAGLLEAGYRKNGHQGLVRLRTFNMDVHYGHIMSGSNLAVPAAAPGPTGGSGSNASFAQGAGNKKIGRNEPVQIDYVGVVEGYMVDQARTYYLGKPPDKFLKIHEIILDIQAKLMELGVPGARAEDLYNTAMEMARNAGLEEGFMGWPQPVPFVGHGVGLELDELPVIGKRSPVILEEGMVIALEPKYILPNEGLAGIENTFVVTAQGLEKLTTFPDEIQIIA